MYDEDDELEDELALQRDEHEDEEEQESGFTPAPLAHPLTFGGVTLVTAGAVDVLAHLGPTGLVIGAIAALVAARHGGDLVGQIGSWVAGPSAPMRTHPSLPPVESRPRGRSQRSFLDRTLGRYPESAVADEDEDELPTPEEMDDWHNAPTEAGHNMLPHLPLLQRRRLPNTERIELASDLEISIHDLVGKAIFVCGIRRHGKTTLGARLAEQLGSHYIPLLVPCLEGDYLSLADVLPRALIAGHKSVDRQYTDYEFVALDSPKAAFHLGYDMLEQGYQVILDMTSYNMLDEAVVMQVNLIRGLFQWANRHPESRTPCHVFLDEAQRYLPQTLSDSVIVDRRVLGELLRAYMDILAIGGKRGIAPVILTQRFAQVNNKIMAQSEVFFLLRQTHDSDLDRCMEYVHPSVATKEQIARLRPGQGVYIGCDGSQQVTTFLPRLSSGQRSRTPQAETARRYAHMPMQRVRWQEAAPTASAHAPSLDPQASSAMRASVPPQEPSLLVRAVNAYCEGATSQPKLAAALKISVWEARKLMPEVEAEVQRRQTEQS